MKIRHAVIILIVVIILILSFVFLSDSSNTQEVVLNDNPFGPEAGDVSRENNDGGDRYESQFIDSPFYSPDQNEQDENVTDTQTYSRPTSTRVYRAYDSFTPSASSSSYNTGTYDYTPYEVEYNYEPYVFDDIYADYSDYYPETDNYEGGYTEDSGDQPEELDGCFLVNLIADQLGVSITVARIIVMVNPSLLAICTTQTTNSFNQANDEEKGY